MANLAFGQLERKHLLVGKWFNFNCLYLLLVSVRVVNLVLICLFALCLAITSKVIQDRFNHELTGYKASVC